MRGVGVGGYKEKWELARAKAKGAQPTADVQHAWVALQLTSTIIPSFKNCLRAYPERLSVESDINRHRKTL